MMSKLLDQDPLRLLPGGFELGGLARAGLDHAGLGVDRKRDLRKLLVPEGGFLRRARAICGEQCLRRGEVCELQGGGCGV